MAPPRPWPRTRHTDQRHGATGWVGICHQVGEDDDHLAVDDSGGEKNWLGQIRGWPAECTCPPPSIKRDCDRRTMSTGRTCLADVQAKSLRLILEACGHSGQKTRARRSLPGPDAGHPLQGDAGQSCYQDSSRHCSNLTVVKSRSRHDRRAGAAFSVRREPTATISQCRVACAAAQRLSREYPTAGRRLAARELPGSRRPRSRASPFAG